MFFGVLIITIVYIPILTLTGIEGKMFQPMAITVMLALAGALVLALTLMPVLCSFLLRGHISEGDNFIMRALKAVYRPALKIALRIRWLVVLGALAFASPGPPGSSPSSARSSCRNSTKARSPPCSTNRSA